MFNSSKMRNILKFGIVCDLVLKSDLAKVRSLFEKTKFSDDFNKK